MVKRTHPDANDVAALAAGLKFEDIEAAARRLVLLCAGGSDDEPARDLLTVLAALAFSKAYPVERELADSLYINARSWLMPYIRPTNDAADVFVCDGIREARG
jgi:hypothetical protein